MFRGGAARPTSFVRTKESQGDFFDKQEITRGLLSAALKRASVTLANRMNSTLAGVEDSSVDPTDGRSVQRLIDSAASRAEWTMTQRPSLSSEQSGHSPTNTSNSTTTESNNKLMYRGNPAITNTALAHSLWATILRPQIDSAIDATCGNGHDSLALARMLFPTSSSHSDSLSRLICLDVQERACENTKRALVEEFGNDELLQSGKIQVLHTSHSPLPIDWARKHGSHSELDENLSVALVVYNLGWLPSNDQGSKEDYTTQMDTTLQSIVDAMLLLRIGGMLSVVTYPKTNASEDLAVRTFLESAALLSSNIDTWQEFLERRKADGEEYNNIVDLVMMSMERLVERGDVQQTWRVSEHKKLGMDRAPILLTATRIK